MLTIRKARPGDAKALAAIAEATFRATFASMNTTENMELHCQRNYGEQIQVQEITNPGMVTLVSENADDLVGFAQLCWGKAARGVVAKNPGEIQRLYVVQHWHGKGIAQQLMSACLSIMEEHGTDVVWLGVWERNPRAIAFYRKLGFVEVGEHVFPLGSDPQRDIVMQRSVFSG